MIKFIDSFYEFIPKKGIFLRAFRYLIRILFNYSYSAFYRIKEKKQFNQKTVIVSLTSYPARIEKIWLTVKSLLNQDFENIHIVLWLSSEQFGSINILPKRLLDLQNKGLKIQLVPDDLRSHKKYFYAFSVYPNHLIITVDDDIIYHPCIISKLIIQHHQYPNDVICHRGVVINKQCTYINWKLASYLDKNIMPTGIGGVLYPPNCYDSRILNAEVIKDTCLNGDDLWLNFMCRLKNSNVRISGFKTGLITIISSQKTSLSNENCGEGKNDFQIEKINKWAIETIGVDFFYNVN